jgi:hypothetical protein
VRRSAALLLLSVFPLGGVRGQARPRWAEFEGVRLGSPIDEVLALNAQCLPVVDFLQFDGSFSPSALAEFAFGYSLPHPHLAADSARVRRALELYTACRVLRLDERAVAVVLASGRDIIAASISFLAADSGFLPIDSIRALIRARWPRPTIPHRRLDSWIGTRYRAYLVARPLGRKQAEGLTAQLVLVDTRACTAFDRLVHRGAGSGTAEAC